MAADLTCHVVVSACCSWACCALQLDNGLKALLVYNPVSDMHSAVHNLITARLRHRFGAERQGQLIRNPCGDAYIHICVKTGTFSDPDDLQVRILCLDRYITWLLSSRSFAVVAAIVAHCGMRC